MSAAQKLTKKQKKSLAFRERKAVSKRQEGKERHKNELISMECNSIPVMEGESVLACDGGTVEGQGVTHQTDGKARDDEERREIQRKKGKDSSRGSRNAEKEDVRLSVTVLKGKKRKRESDGSGSEGEADRQEVVARKRRRSVEGESDDEENMDKSKQRFILFIGNLKYTTTKESIEKHFSLCDPPPTIRLLTPKAKPGSAQKAKSKGCAFLEFTHRNALQQALKLHQSNLDGRLINVELTAGGGGKSEPRLAKVRERNKALLGQREKRLAKDVPEDVSSRPQKPQRFSMTSGMVQKSVTKKTWTVGDVEDGQAHRGGERHRKKSKSKPKSWGTGVNAIPVG